MNTRRASIIGISAFIVIAVLAAIPPCLYIVGLEGVPNDREPLAQMQIPESVSRSYWRFLQGEGNPRISQRNPYGFLFDVVAQARNIEADRHPSAEYALVSDAARMLMFREEFDGRPNDWHLSNLAAMIWVSRNWSAEDAINTVLPDTYFGNGFKGIDAAARGYLGVSLNRLNDAQTAYLLVIRMAPSLFDLWCNPENHRARFEAFAERTDYTVSYESIESLPAPLDACSSSPTAWVASKQDFHRPLLADSDPSKFHQLCD